MLFFSHIGHRVEQPKFDLEREILKDFPWCAGMREMAMRTYDRLYIGGEWVSPHSGRVIASIDPSTEEVWAEVAEADGTDVDRAVAAAKTAMAGPWKTK